MGRIQKAVVAIFNERKELGRITQNDLAHLWGCSQSMISSLLGGYKQGGLTAERIEQFCDYLGITLAELETIRPSPKSIVFRDPDITCDQHKPLHICIEELLHRHPNPYGHLVYQLIVALHRAATGKDISSVSAENPNSQTLANQTILNKPQKSEDAAQGKPKQLPPSRDLFTSAKTGCPLSHKGRRRKINN